MTKLLALPTLVLICASTLMQARQPPNRSLPDAADAQDKPTARIQALLDEANQPDRPWADCLGKCKKAEEEAKSSSDIEGQAEAAFFAAYASVEVGKPTEGAALYEETITLLQKRAFETIANSRGPEQPKVRSIDFLGCAFNNVGVLYAVAGSRPRQALYLLLRPENSGAQTDGRALRAAHLGFVPPFPAHAPPAEGCFNAGLGCMTTITRLPGIGALFNNQGAYTSKSPPVENAFQFLDTGMAEFADWKNRRIGMSLTSGGVKTSDMRRPEYYKKLVAGNAVTWANYGYVYAALSQYSQADGCYEQAATKFEEANDPESRSTILSRLGEIEILLDRIDEAIEKFNEALSIQKAAKDPIGQAITLNGLGRAYERKLDPVHARDSYEKARDLAKSAGDELDAEASTNAIAKLQTTGATGEKETVKTEPNPAGTGQLESALAKAEAAGDVNEAADLLVKIGTDQAKQGHKDQAIQAFARALSKVGLAGNGSEIYYIDKNGHESVGANAIGGFERTGVGLASNPSVERKALDQLADLTSRDSPGASVWFQSEAVRVLEGQRAGGATFRGGATGRFLESEFAEYDRLAGSLISLRRCSNAQEILLLAKTDPQPGLLTRVPGTKRENLWSDAFIHMLSQIGRHHASPTDYLDPLYRADSPKTPSRAEIDAFLKNLAKADEQDVTKFLLDVIKTGKDADPDPLTWSPSPNFYTRAERELNTELAKLPAGSMAVYVLPDPGGVELMTVRAGKVSVQSVRVEGLEQKVDRFLGCLKDPEVDPRPLGKQLFDVLVKPIEGEFASQQVSMWYVGGYLKKLPIGALYDGTEFFVEKYGSALLALASVPDLDLAVRQDRSAVVFGTSVRRQVKDPVSGLALSFSELPGVAEEMSIVGEILHAKPALDDSFTRASITEGLKSKPAIVHIGTHFRYYPGDDRRSFLVIGDGNLLSIDEIKSGFKFSGVDLLTLSACSTNVGENFSGADVESLASLCLNQGAHSVISTLWPISDRSSALLMADFYRMWKQGGTKLECLRRAQLNMLRGKTPDIPAHGQVTKPRSGPVSAPGSAADAPPWPKNYPRYAHPYYWAPFVLTGNWK